MTLRYFRGRCPLRLWLQVLMRGLGRFHQFVLVLAVALRMLVHQLRSQPRLVLGGSFRRGQLRLASPVELIHVPSLCPIMV